MQIHDARLSGSAFVSGNMNPDADLTYCLGLPNLRWKTIYGGTVSGTFIGDGSGLTGIAAAGDTNYYPTALTFNSANGNLQLSGVGMDTLTANLDGRYCTTDTDTDTNSYLVSQSFNAGTGWFCSFRNDGLPVISTSLDGRWVLISDFLEYSESVSNSIELLSSSFEDTSESLAEWSNSLDLYDGWKLYVDDSDKGLISGNEIVNVKAGTGVGLSYSSTNNTITISTNSNLQFDSIGVGTPASGVTGEIRATNNITAYYSSDRRIKTNIIRISNPLEKIERINGVEFNWTDEYLKIRGGIDGVFIRQDNIGVIAQEIEEVLPQVVINREDGIKAVNYEMIIPLLIESIKELKKELDEIKKKI
jgi:hypothetical protein